MTIDEIRKEIARRTGVPVSLLNGETAEENAAQAKALLAYRREGQEREQTTAEQFSRWLSEQFDGNEPQDAEKRTTRDQFADWMKNQFL